MCGKGWGKPFGGACFGGLKLWLFFAQFSRVILVFFFLRSEAVIPDRFKNLILLIDGLSFGTFGFHPHEGFEDELILYIQKTNERVKTLFVKIDLNGIKFGFLRTHS